MVTITCRALFVDQQLSTCEANGCEEKDREGGVSDECWGDGCESAEELRDWCQFCRTGTGRGIGSLPNQIR